MQEKSTEKLKKDVEAKRGQLEQWSSTAYGEVGMTSCCLYQERLQIKRRNKTSNQYGMLQRAICSAVLSLTGFVATCQAVWHGHQLPKMKRRLKSFDYPDKISSKAAYLWQHHFAAYCNLLVGFLSVVHSAGIQCLDPYLCYPTLHWKYPEIWTAPKILGLPAEAKPQASYKAAQNAGQHVWIKWWVLLSRPSSWQVTSCEISKHSLLGKCSPQSNMPISFWWAQWQG